MQHKNWANILISDFWAVNATKIFEKANKREIVSQE